MDSVVEFTFRQRSRLCITVIDSHVYPSYIFVILLDDELINEFSDEISIKTDFDKCLPGKNIYPQLTLLQQAIFEAVKSTKSFLSAKAPLENKMEKNKHA